MSNAPHKAADKVNIFAIVLVGIASSLLIWATMVALTGYYLATEGPVADSRSALGLEEEKRSIKSAQLGLINRLEPNTVYADALEGEQCFNNPIDGAMRRVVADAQADRASLVPAVVAETLKDGETKRYVPTISPIPGYPIAEGTVASPVEPTAVKRVVVTEENIQINEKIQFNTGKAGIADDSRALIDELAAVFKTNPQIERVEVAGHTDNQGGPAANLRLSKARALAVVAALVERGVDSKRLKAEGYGPNKPIAENTTDEGRDKNRRVEFVIIKMTPVVKEELVPAVPADGAAPADVNGAGSE